VTAVAAQRLARGIMRSRARSFSWAARLLPAAHRDDATALYAWCRRCDDAVDTVADPATAARAVARLRNELAQIYAGVPMTDPILAGLQEVVRRHALPRLYAEELVAGMAMDVGAVRYPTFEALLLYCYRAAGTVGLMMAHIMGVRDAQALRHAADLGIAMQLTNICRDVAEDEGRGRVYLPAELLGPEAPRRAGPRAGAAAAELLRRADGFYGSGDAGLPALPWRCAAAVRAARLIYAEIGRVLARRRWDLYAGRAVVSPARKAWLVVRAIAGTVWARARPWAQPTPAATARGGAA
jgi:phytoene synthase